MDNVFKLHGLPKTIVSNRDVVFIRKFWKELFQLKKVSLLTSTTYHPQTDGQTEVVNKCLECYLRCITSEKPKEWPHWLPLAEWWYNTSFHSAIWMSPYEVVYGQTPPPLLPYMPLDSQLDMVDRSLHARESTLRTLRCVIWKELKAEWRIMLINIGLTDPMRLENGCMWSCNLTGNCLWRYIFQKLSAKFLWPFQIVAKIRKVAYTLALPAHTRIHPTFQISRLKSWKGSWDLTLHLSICLLFSQIIGTLSLNLKLFLINVWCLDMVKLSLRSWSNGFTLLLKIVPGKTWLHFKPSSLISILEDKDSWRSGYCYMLDFKNNS